MIWQEITQDWNANKGNIKGRYVMFSYRIASLLEKNKLIRYIFFPFYLHHKIWISWILGIELQPKVQIGQGCKLYHGQGLVLNSEVKIGKNCILRHNVTIGNKVDKNGNDTKCPIIGDDFEVGANSVIIGPITIGDNVKVGACSLVNKDIPSNSIAVGIPVKIKPTER